MTSLVKFEAAFFATKGGVDILSATSAASLAVTNNVDIGGDVAMATFTLTDSGGVEWEFKVLPGGILQGTQQ